MVFFPHIGEIDEKKFRDVAINSLGYNNLLYIATVFAELEVVNKNHGLFTVLLIEEPSAFTPANSIQINKIFTESSKFKKESTNYSHHSFRSNSIFRRCRINNIHKREKEWYIVKKNS